MSPSTNATAQVDNREGYNLVGGAGGTRAILATSGVILACYQAGIKWRTAGGASGGAVPTSMLAAGVHPVQIIRMAIEMNFADKLTRHGGWWQVLLAYFMKERYEITRPHKGILSSEKLGEFADSFSSGWTDVIKYWTVASTDGSQVLFTADGVFEYDENNCLPISNLPPPIGIALRATCAVPGIIDAVALQVDGKELHLLDGALGIDQRCPIGVVKRIFGQPPQRIIACDVGDEKRGIIYRMIRWCWKKVGGEDSLPKMQDDIPKNADDVILIQPNITSVRSLQFTPTADQKWQAVMTGYIAAVEQLEKSGLLPGKILEDVCTIKKLYQILVKSNIQPGELTWALEKLLKCYGLYW